MESHTLLVGASIRMVTLEGLEALWAEIKNEHTLRSSYYWLRVTPQNSCDNEEVYQRHSLSFAWNREENSKK